MLSRIYQITKLVAVLSVIPVMICLSLFLVSLKSAADQERRDRDMLLLLKIT